MGAATQSWSEVLRLRLEITPPKRSESGVVSVFALSNRSKVPRKAHKTRRASAEKPGIGLNYYSRLDLN